MRSAKVIVGAVCVALLGAATARIFAAGAKTGGSVTIVDDLSFGSTGSSSMTAAGGAVPSLVGSLGQTGNQQASASGVVVDGGYFAFGGAAQKIWNGVVGGAASAGSNWVGGVAPVSGDFISFGAPGGANTSCTWDLNISIASMTVYNAYTSSITLTTDLDAGAGINSLAGPSATLDLKGHKISLSGNLSVNGWNQTSTVAGATVAFYGAGDSIVSGAPGSVFSTFPGTLNFPTLVVNKNAGNKVILNGIYQINGDFVLNTGTFTPSAMGSNKVYLLGNFYQTGGYLDRGYFGVTSDWTLMGNSPQTMGASGGTRARIDNLWVWNASTITLTAGFNFGLFTATQPATTLIFPTGVATSILTQLTIDGQSPGTRVMLKSASPGVQALINYLGFSLTVNNAFVKDINSSGGGLITASNSVDGGDNLNWSFSGGGGGVPTQVSLNAISEARALRKAPNGFLYEIGFSSSGANSKDIWLAKFDTSMNLLSSATVAGAEPGDDMAKGVALDANSNLFAVGFSSVAGSGRQIWLGKFDQNLNLLSSATFSAPFPDASFNQAHGVAVSTFAAGALAAGDVVVSGAINVDGTNHKLWLGHYNNSLQFVSSGTYFNGTNPNADNQLALDGAGNIYVAGFSGSTERVMVAKFNSNLVFLTSATRTSLGGNNEMANGIVVDPSGNIFVTGFVNNTGTVGNAWVAKYTSNLALLNEISYPNQLGSGTDEGSDIALGNNGNIVVAGDVNLSGPGDIIWFAELNPSLSLVSSSTISNQSPSQGYGIAVDSVTNQAFAGGWITNGANHNAWLGRFGITNSVPVFASANDISPAVVGGNAVGTGLLRLSLRTGQATASLNSLLVSMQGNAPSANTSVKLYKDTVGDGVFRSTTDLIVASLPFGAGTPPQAQLNFSPQTLTTTTQYFFLGVDLSNVPAGKQVGVGIDFGSRFGLTNGFMSNQPIYPLLSGQSLVQQILYANPSTGGYPAPTGGASPTGGLDTGIFLQSGQNVAVSGSGSWTNNGVNTNPNGLGTTGGLAGGLSFGSLVGRVGAGAWQQLGTNVSTMTAGQQGDLFLAMNSTTSANDSGSISINAQVLTSTVAKVWVGLSGVNQNATVNANWLNGLPPIPGDTVVFDGGVSTQSCNWDIYGANISLLKLTTSYTGAVTLAPAAFQLTVSTTGNGVIIKNGVLSLGGAVTLAVQGSLNIQGGTFDMGSGGAFLNMANGGAVALTAGAFRSVGTGQVQIQSPAAYPSFQFNALGGSLNVNNPGGTQLNNTSRLFISSSVSIAALNAVGFINPLYNPQASLVLNAVSPINVTFSNLNFDLNTSTNVDASNVVAGSTITLLNAAGQRMGSPFARDPNGVLAWSPDGGGLATVSGQLTNASGQGNGAAYTIKATTSPGGGGPIDVFLSTGNGIAAQNFTLTGLTAPNTWYFIAWNSSLGGLNPPINSDPRGGYGNPGFQSSIPPVPVFLGAGATLGNINIAISSWTIVQGNVTNNSSQSGPIVVQAWEGVPGLSTSTLKSRVAFVPGGGSGASFLYTLPAPATSLYLLGFVDINGNGVQYPFEASGTSAVVTGLGGVTLSNVNISIAGGASAPGGTLSVGTANPFPAHSGFVGAANGQTLPQAMLRLDLSAAGSNVTWNGLRVDVGGTTPSLGYYVGLWRNDAGGGIFNNPSLGGPGPFDSQLGSAFVSGGVSSTTVSFFAPETLIPGTTKTYFVTLDLQGQGNIPLIGLSLGGTSYFSLSQGAGAVQTSTFPVQSGLAPPKWAVFANIPAYSPSGGGQDTSRYVAAGQSVTANLVGSWTVSPGSVTTSAGLSGTQGQATVAPSANLGQIIGRVGDFYGNGTTWFPVLSGTPFTSGASGTVWLAQNNYPGSPYASASGAVFGTLSVAGSTAGAISGYITYVGTASAGNLVVRATYQPPPACTTCAFTSQLIAMSAGTTFYAYTLAGVPPGPTFVEAFVGTNLNQRGSLPAPVNVIVGSTVAFQNFTMALGLGSISGTLSYSGIQNFGQFFIGAATSAAQATGGNFIKSQFSSSAGAYTLSSLPTPNTYYILGFRDVNGDGYPDGPEPFGVYGNSAGAAFDPTIFTPVFLDTGASAGLINVSLVDRGAMSGNVSGAAAISSTTVTVLVGHGAPGSASYVVDDEASIPVTGLPANWSLYYTVGLLRPATDYSLFAFIDPAGSFSPGDNFGQLNGPFTVSSAGFTNANIAIAGPQPPPPVTGFAGLAVSTTAVQWTWNGESGGSVFNLKTSSGGLRAVVSSTTLSYLDFIGSTNTYSPIVSIQSSNTFGGSALSQAPPVATLAAPVAAAPTVPVVNLSSMTLSWYTGGNSTSTVYWVQRATSATGQFFVLATTTTQNATTAGFTDVGLVPNTLYAYKIIAVNLNGIQAAASPVGTATTLGSGGTSNISGTVLYQGTQNGGIVVQVFTSSAFTPTSTMQAVLQPNSSQQFFISAPPSASYYLRAFVDVFGTQSWGLGEDFGAIGPVAVGAGPSFPYVTVSITSNTIPPGPPTGLTTRVMQGLIGINWNGPNVEINGAPLNDLAGFRVKRSTIATGPYITISTGAAFGVPGAITGTAFNDYNPIPGVVNYYNIVAVDYGGYAGPPSQTNSVTPINGGAISGTIQLYGPNATGGSGPLRVRLSSTPIGGGFLTESDQNPYSFTGLNDGNYFVRAFRDSTGGGSPKDFDPVGALGGIGQPYPVFVFNASSITSANFPVCDRSTVTFGTPASPSSVSGATSVSGCPALDQGLGFYTSLYSFRVGNGAAGSIGVNTNISISMQSSYTNRLLVLGPDGFVAAQDASPGGASVNFTVFQPGLYMIEPTSFNPGDTGAFTLNLNQAGGFAGTISGSVSYSGSQGGPVIVELFNTPNSNAAPVGIATFTAPGAYSVPGVPDGLYFVRAFRDSRFHFEQDAGDPSGVFGVSASSLTAVTIQGGKTFVNGVQAAPGSINITMTDPALGSVTGQILRQGSLTGTIRVDVGTPQTCSGCGIKVVNFTTIPAAGLYTVPFLPPATNYLVQAYVDLNNNGQPDTLEPYASTSPISVQANAASNVSLLVQDPGSGAAGNATVSGTISYGGSATGTLRIGIASDPNFRVIPYYFTQSSVGSYFKAGIVGGTTYYVGAFIDVNNDGSPDPIDPIGTYGPSAPLFVPQSGAVTANFTILDPPGGAITGQVSYSGTAPLSQKIFVQAYSPTAGSNHGYGQAVLPRQAGVSQYNFLVPFLAAATDYNVIAFVDAAGNGNPAPGEPFSFFGTPTCTPGGQCASSPVAVSSGPGTFATPGINMQLNDFNGGGPPLANTGGIFGDVVYLGTQGGPLYVRAFTNSSYTGTPAMTVAVPGPSGPGHFHFGMPNLAFGTTYYLDAFRDPSNTGLFNQTFDAYGTLNLGQGILLSPNQPGFFFGGDKIVDPGQGGSVNAYSGSFASPGGARFDGGATDIGGSVAVDTFSVPGSTFVYVLGLTAQNSGIVWSLAKYNSAGVFLASTTLPSSFSSGKINLDPAGRILLGDKQNGKGVVYRYSPNLSLLNQAVLAGSKVKSIAFANGFVYAAISGGNGLNVRKLDPNADLVEIATGTYNFPAPQNGSTNGRAVAADPFGNIYVVADFSQGGPSLLAALLKYGPNLDFSGAPQVADLSSLGISPDNLSLAADGAGNVFLSFAPQGQGKALTYKFNSNLKQVASAVYAPILVNLSVNGSNLGLDAQGHVYEAWESPVNGGDYLAVHYDNNLNQVATQTFDGFNNTLEDFPLGVAVQDSSNVFVTGGVNNSANLDWATVRFNMNSNGATSAPPPATTLVISSAITGAISYTGSLMSSGTIRAALFPLGASAAVRFATATFGASASYLFNNVTPGVYQVKAFVDANNSFQPAAGEAVGLSPASGLVYTGGIATQNLALCDRRQIAMNSSLTDTITPADCAGPDRGGAFTRFYTFSGLRGQAVTILNQAVNFVDSALVLYDPNGALLATGDDSGPTANAVITNFALPSNGLYTIAASPFAAGLTSATITLSLSNSAGSLGSVSGAISYTGVEGGQLIAGLFSSSTFNSQFLVQKTTAALGQTYVFGGLPTGTTYFAAAFIDVNSNGRPDPGEDTGFFGSSVTGPAAIFLRSGQNLTGINFNIAPGLAIASVSTATVSGVVSYNGTRTGPVRVELWANSSFSGTPLGVRLLPSAGAYDLPVPANSNYFLRSFMDVANTGLFAAGDPLGFYSRSGVGADPLFVAASTQNINITLIDPGQSASGAGVSGDGTASILPLTAAAGAAFSSTITYTAGGSSIAAGGKAGFIVPPGFALPQNISPALPGYVTFAGTTAATLALSTSGAAAFVSVQAGILRAGENVSFVYNNVNAPCFVSTVTFTVGSGQNQTVTPQALIAGSPILNVSKGSAVLFQPTVPFFSVTQNQVSNAQTLEARDACGNKAAVGGTTTVPLKAKTFNQGLFQEDTTVYVATSTAMLLLSPTDFANVTFSAGQSSQTFYAQSLSTGSKNIELSNPVSGGLFYFGFTALPSNALTGVAVAAFSPLGLSSGTSVTIYPGDPTQANIAYINFQLGNSNVNWHVMVSSVPYKTGVVPNPVWDVFGVGQPGLSQIGWDGRFGQALNGGGRVPAGVYYVRIEVAGSVRDDSLNIAVRSPQLLGNMFDAGSPGNPCQPAIQACSPLAQASLQAFGSVGGGAAAADSLGNYVLAGLAAQTTYQLALTRVPDYLSAQVVLSISASGAPSFTALSNVTVSTNASGGLDFGLFRAPVLSVYPNGPQGSLGLGLSTASFNQFGTLQVLQSTTCGGAVISSTGSFAAPLRLVAGTTVFDDGGQWDPTLQQNVAHSFFKFQVNPATYAVTATLPGFTPVCFSQFVGLGGGEIDISSSLFTVQRSSVSGLVTLASNPNGALVSVNAIPLASTGTPGFSTLFLNAGLLQSTYVVTNLDSGNYILRATLAGSTDSIVGPISVPLAVPGSFVNLPAFGAGAAINGTVTINADTTGRNLALSVSAWAPGALDIGSTIVYRSGGASGTAIPYVVSGLNAGTTYQVYVNLSYGGGLNLDVLQSMPSISSAPGTVNFTYALSSGVVNGTILLPAGATDFSNVTLSGAVFASPRPDQVGRVIPSTAATTLPNFACVPVACNGVTGSSTATFSVQGLNTETDDLTLFYKTNGQDKKIRVSVVNGSTTTVFVDLSAPSFSISGLVADQVSTTTFNTMYKIVHSTVDAPLLDLNGNLVDLSYAPVPVVGRSTATLARVLAIRQDISAFVTAISTSFDPARSRVGFLTEGGTYTINNVPPGVYLVRTEPLRTCAGCAPSVPSVGQIVHVSNFNVFAGTFTLSDGFSVSGVISFDQQRLDSDALTLTVTDHRQQVVASTTVYIGDPNLGLTANSVGYSFANLPAGEFYNLAVQGVSNAGRPIKFPDPALSPNGLQGNLANQNLLMQRAAFIKGRLQDANSGSLIGAANAALLAPNFTISAKANPWVEGGFVVAASSLAGRPIRGDGTFLVGPLLPAISYDLSLTQSNWDVAFLSQGSQNYAPVTVSGLTPQPGEARDVGLVSLYQGQSVSGTVCQSTTTACAAGAPLLGNIKVTARPTFGSSGLLSQTFTNPSGRYTIWVSTSLSNEYDLTAAPADGNTASNGQAYAQNVRRAVNLATTTAVSADFQLAPLPLAVTGQVVVVDSGTGGDLRYPFGDKKGFPAAAINLQLTGTIPTSDPLGDISGVTDERGVFIINVSTIGAYDLKAASLGYSVCKAAVVVTASSVTISGADCVAPGGLLVLQRGGTITGRIVKINGSYPADSEVGGIAAANFKQKEFVVGSVDVDRDAKTINSYTIAGFKTGVPYDIVLLPKNKKDGIIFPPEGSSVTFTTAESTTTKTIDLTYLSSDFDCQATAKDLHESTGTDASGSNPAGANNSWIDQFSVKVDCNKALRSAVSGDNNLDQLISLSTVTAPWPTPWQPVPASASPQPNAPYGLGLGRLLSSDKALSADRRTLTGLYRVDTASATFSVTLNLCAAEVNPKTGSNFCLTKVVDFFEGLKSHATQNVSNIQGDTVGIVPAAVDESSGTDSNDQSSIAFAPGSFAECSSASTDECDSGADNANDVVLTSRTVKVGMSKTKDLSKAQQKVHEQGLGGAPAIYVPLAAPGYLPPVLERAQASLRTMDAGTGFNPLSSFYNIFLPATVRHQLRAAADVTLSFSVDVSTWSQADLNKLNVWHFLGNGVVCPDGFNSVNGFCRELTNKRVNLANKTITVRVNSLSPFLVGVTPVLTAPAPVTGGDIQAFNFPNPVDCITHSNIQRDTSVGFAVGSTFAPFFGTMVRYSLPPGPTQDFTFNIYNVAGQLVQHNTAPRAGGATYYDTWDCTNQTGHTVASGVYIGEIFWGGQHKFIKIAIVKGSGL